MINITPLIIENAIQLVLSDDTTIEFSNDCFAKNWYDMIKHLSTTTANIGFIIYNSEYYHEIKKKKINHYVKYLTIKNGKPKIVDKWSLDAIEIFLETSEPITFIKYKNLYENY